MATQLVEAFRATRPRTTGKSFAIGTTWTFLSTMAENAQYFNILLLGRTGYGKSTTGNKLLQAGVKTSGMTKVIKRWTSLCNTLLKGSSELTSVQTEFAVGHEAKSCTTKCEILSSSNVRVIDVPGFGGSERQEGLDVKQLNTQYIRWIIRIKQELEMVIHRVLYFIPHRGVLRKADGAMKEELESLQYFFGNIIFESMIMIATYDSEEEEQQARGFREKDSNDTQTTLKVMFDSMPKLKGVLPCVPPLIYLGFNDSPDLVYSKVMQAPVSKVDGIELSVLEGTCIKCAKRAC